MAEAVDRISNLPDDILHYIISFLGNTKSAAQTSILSNRWRHLWTFNPNFDIPLNTSKQIAREKYVRNVERCLQVYKSEKLLSVSFDIFLNLNLPFSPNFHQWIRFAVERSVEYLTIYVKVGQGNIRRFKLPSFLFRCGSLKYLDLTSCTFYLPTDFKGFPFLNSVRLSWCKFNDESVHMILAKCPFLESLQIDHGPWLRSLKISGSDLPLKRFSYCGQLERLEICAPNLHHLVLFLEISVPNRHPLELKTTNFPAIYLRNAPLLHKVGLYGFVIHRDDYRKFIDATTSVSILQINPPFLKFIFAEYYLYGSPLRMFKNLKEFHVRLPLIINKAQLLSLVTFFRDCPCLEKICINFVFDCQYESNYDAIFEYGKPPIYFGIEEEFQRIKGEQKFECLDYLLHNLKTVEINNFSGDENHMLLVKFLLKKAIILKLLNLTFASKKDDHLLCQQLFLLPRSSLHSQIVIS